MNAIVAKSRTIDEKITTYNPTREINYDYLKEWRNVNTLLKDKPFKEMLKQKNIEEKEFAYSLQPLIDIEHIEEDNWYDDFKNIVESFEYNTIDYNMGISVASLPFIHYFANKLNKVLEEIDTRGNVEIEEEVLTKLIAAHNQEMFGLVGKIVALKLAEYKRQNEFKTDTPEEHFKEFLENTFSCKEDFENLYNEYPVLARVATVRTNFLINNYTTMFNNINKDYKEVMELLNLNKLHLLDITLSTGDSHQQGNAVSILKFEGKNLVYKPRDLNICKAFEKFIDWYASNSNLLPIKIPRGVYKDGYSYNEFIDQKYCNSEEEVERFYTRYGYLIGICYLMGMNDLHLENIIAHGEHPVIIDIETMFQVPNRINESTLQNDLLSYLRITSVAGSLLLPSQVNLGGKEEIDLSALSGREAELKQKILAPTNINTDSFHFEDTTGYFAGGNNIPKYNKDEEVNVDKYNLYILEGFNEFIKFIKSNKEGYINQLQAFQGCKVRTLTKSTERYASMIRYADHPSYNKEMKYRERLMLNIWAYPYRDKRIVSSEVRDMIFNDIPVFFSYIDSRDIIDSYGKVYPNYHERSGYELAIEKINKLDDKEIDRQRTILISSLGLVDDYMNRQVAKRQLSNKSKKVNYVLATEKVAQELQNNAYVRDEYMSFLNVDCDVNNHWSIVPMDSSLYGGLSGVAVMLLELYKHTSKQEYYDMYKKVLNTAVQQSDIMPMNSGFSGMLAPAYPIILEYKYFGTLSHEAHLNRIKKTMAKIDDKILAKTEENDYIGGLAGTIRVLQLISDTFEEKYITNTDVKRFYDLLIRRINNNEVKAINNAGIAHGLSGIALGIASARIADIADIKKILHAEAKIDVPANKEYKWCWGIPGMIQARLELWKMNHDYIDKVELQELVDRFETMLDKIIDNDSLCHGNGSIVTTLKMLYDYSGDDKWAEIIDKYLYNMQLSYLNNGYQVEQMSDVQTKGLFDGISGIGWLHLYAKEDMNNVMLLEA